MKKRKKVVIKKKKKRSLLGRILSTCLILTAISMGAAFGVSYYLKISPLKHSMNAMLQGNITEYSGTSDTKTGSGGNNDPGADSVAYRDNTDEDNTDTDTQDDDDIPMVYDPSVHKDEPQESTSSGVFPTYMKPYGYYDSIGTTVDDANRRATKSYDEDGAYDITGYSRTEPEIVGTIDNLETILHPEVFVQTPDQYYNTQSINAPGNNQVPPQYQNPDQTQNTAQQQTQPATSLQLPTAPTVVSGGAPIKIACVGDSITYGATLQDRNTQSYPALLQTSLGSGYHVSNFGKGGSGLTLGSVFPYKTTDEYRASIENNADIYIVMLGTNDAVPAIWNAEQYITELTGLCKDYLNRPSHPRVILMTSPKFFGVSGYSRDPEYEMYDSIISSEIAPAIHGVSRSLGLTLIDMYSFTSSHPEWFPDNVHPNAEGHYQMAALVSGALR